MILSTNTKLISLGQDYSAGENIGINDRVISSRNWTPDITYAAESAFQRANEYTNTQISALSGEVSSEVSQLGSDIQYISGVALTAHQSLEGYLTKASGDEYYQPIGSYATVSQLESTSGEIVNLIPTDYVNTETLEQTSGNIVNLIPDTSEFITNVSAEQTYQPIGNYLSSNALEGYATQDWVENKGYLTSVSIPESATWQDVSTTVQTNSAQWADGGTGDEEVNSFVYNNSATINDVNTSYQTNSGDFLTAAPADMATTGDVAELAQTISETYQVKGDYLTTADSANFYPNNNPSGFITGVDLSNYYTKDETSGKEELSNAFANVPTPDYEVESYIHNNSASINSTTDVVQSNSSVWSDITAYQSNSASYLTAHQSLDGYATETLVQDTSANITALIPDTSNFITNASAESTYQTIEGMTAYQPAGSYATTSELEQVSADITATIPSTAGLASESYVQTNSAVLTGMIDGKQDTLTFGYDEQDRISAINNSALAGGTDLEFGFTDADTISSINNSALTDVSLNNIVQTNSGVWGGSALPISAGPGIDVQLTNNTLVFSAIPNETVLYSGVGTTAASLSEPITNFESVKITYYPNEAFYNSASYITEFPTTNTLYTFNVNRFNDTANNAIAYFNALYEVQNGVFTEIQNNHYWIGINDPTNIAGPGTVQTFISKIVGINRK